MRALTRRRQVAGGGVLLLCAGFLGGWAVNSSNSSGAGTRTVVITSVGAAGSRSTRATTEPSRPKQSNSPQGTTVLATPATVKRPLARASSPRPVHPKQSTVSAIAFSGDGPVMLGTLTLERSQTLRWTSTGGHFEILFGNGEAAVRSTAATGELFAPTGTYQAVAVHASGHWTLRTVRAPSQPASPADTHAPVFGPTRQTPLRPLP